MMSTPPAPLEAQIVRWLTERWQRNEPRLSIPIGDDAAWVQLDHRSCVVATDMLMEGIHFESGTRSDWERVGTKSVGVNLSDLAAMAAQPIAVFVSLALPPNTTLSDVQRLYQGMETLCERYAISIAGGDTNFWQNGLVANVTAIGVPVADQLWTRSGGQPGDVLCVTGPLGGSRLAKHWCASPRVELAGKLARKGVPVHAAMDISDGLALDLSRLCAASGCGAELVADEIPVSNDAQTLSRRTGQPALQHALSDGEDFELLLAIDPESLDPARQLLDSHEPLYPIGKLTAAPELVLVVEGNTRIPLQPTGYWHG